MYKVACTRKETSCIIGNLLSEIVPACDVCEDLEGDAVVLMGHSAISGDVVKITLTDYGFEFEGNPSEVEHIRKARCLYGAIGSTEKD